LLLIRRRFQAYRFLDQIENELKLVQVKREEADKVEESPVVSAFSQPSQLQTLPPAAAAADQLSSPIVRQLNTQVSVLSVGLIWGEIVKRDFLEFTGTGIEV
jgi:hypothetical protein